MKYIIRNKLLIIFLLLSITFSCVTPINAQQADNNDNSLALISDNLNKLGLLSGDGKGNYNTNNTLKRTEATTFIAKLMGKYNYIQDNKNTLKKTKFKDVAQTDWFAPYVGFCYSNNIVSGYSNELYGVKDNTTEQAFLVMLLKLLNYTDLKWNDNVFKKAYEVGLASDKAYLSKTKDDNNSFTRGKAILCMNSALKIKISGQDKTLIKSLIEQGAVKADIAKALGYNIANNSTPFIKSVKALNAKQIQVIYNLSMNKASVENTSYYEIKDNGTTLISLVDGAVNYNETTKDAVITLNNKISDRLSNLTTTKLTIKKGIKDFNGKVMADDVEYDVNVEDFESPQLVSAESTDEKTVKLTFSEPVYINNKTDSISFEHFNIYGIGKKYNISRAKLSDNIIYLSLTECMQKGNVTIKFNNDILSTPNIITDYADNSAIESVLSFIFGDDTSSPVVSAIQVMNAKQIKIDFSTVMDKDSIQDSSFYEIKDDKGKSISITNESINQVGLKSVLITLNNSINSKLTKGTTIGVKVKKGLKSTDGKSISKDTEIFIPVVDNSIPNISRAEVVGEKTLRIIFLEPIYNGTNTDTLNTDNFRITCNTAEINKNPITNEIKVLSAKFSDNVITLTSDEILPEGVYSITVNTNNANTNAIQDYAGNKVPSKVFNFKYSKEITARVLSLNKLEVIFPMEMDSAYAKNIIFYEIKDKGTDLVPAVSGGVTYDTNSLSVDKDIIKAKNMAKKSQSNDLNNTNSINRSKTAVITLSRNLTNGTTAKLVIKNGIKSAYGEVVCENTEVDVPVSDTVAPRIVSVKVIGDKTIKLILSESVHTDSESNILENNIFSVGNYKQSELELKLDENNKNILDEKIKQDLIKKLNQTVKSYTYFVTRAKLSDNIITLTLSEKLKDGQIGVIILNIGSDENIIKDYAGNKQIESTKFFDYSKGNIY